MAVTVLRPVPTDPHPAPAEGLRERAVSLRAQAPQLGPVLATTYRRRASELELEAFLVGLLAGDDVTGAPAA